jgi:hypothetical protein
MLALQPGDDTMDTLMEILAEPLILLGFVVLLLGATSLVTRIMDGTWNIIDPDLRR